MNTARFKTSHTFELPAQFSFSHVFQPIFTLKDDTLFGYESLLRGSIIQNPEQLFSVAEKNGFLFELDMSSIVKAIETFSQTRIQHNNSLYLTANVYPSTLLHPQFLWMMHDVLEKTNFPPNKIVLEMNEAEAVLDLAKLQTVVFQLKALGFIIALDDLGKGQSSLRIALELEPDVIKLDRYFSINLENSGKKQKFVEWITSYFHDEGVIVTLEGIETIPQLAIAKQAGVRQGQGYLLGRPQVLEIFEK